MTATSLKRTIHITTRFLILTTLALTFTGSSRSHWIPIVNIDFAVAMGSEITTALGYGIAVDPSGNVYTTGSFTDTVDFDPGPGTFNLTTAGFTDTFIQKLDADGNLLWVKSLGGTGSGITGRGIALDTAGNVYTTGRFSGTVDFDPGPGIHNITYNGIQDIFVHKLDTDGNFVWAKTAGGANHDRGFDIALDASNNVYITGHFEGNTDFDPGPGIFILTSNGFDDIFIQKLDENGNFLWAKAVGGINSDEGWSIAVNDSGDVHTIGIFRGTVDFDPNIGTEIITSSNSGNNTNAFVQKLDSNGNLLWAKSFESRRGNGIAVDAFDNVYISGSYSLGFVQKLDSMGNVLWYQFLESSGGSIRVEDVAVDSSGNVYTTGGFQHTIDFDPGPGILNLTSNANHDIFVHKLDSNGNFVWVRSMGGLYYTGTYDDVGHGIALDSSGKAHVTGYFSGFVDFGTTTLGWDNNRPNIFVMKLEQLPIPFVPAAEWWAIALLTLAILIAALSTIIKHRNSEN